MKRDEPVCLGVSRRRGQLGVRESLVERDTSKLTGHSLRSMLRRATRATPVPGFNSCEFSQDSTIHSDIALRSFTEYTYTSSVLHIENNQSSGVARLIASPFDDVSGNCKFVAMKPNLVGADVELEQFDQQPVIVQVRPFGSTVLSSGLIEAQARFVESLSFETETVILLPDQVKTNRQLQSLKKSLEIAIRNRTNIRVSSVSEMSWSDIRIAQFGNGTSRLVNCKGEPVIILQGTSRTLTGVPFWLKRYLEASNSFAIKWMRLNEERDGVFGYLPHVTLGGLSVGAPGYHIKPNCSIAEFNKVCEEFSRGGFITIRKPYTDRYFTADLSRDAAAYTELLQTTDGVIVQPPSDDVLNKLTRYNAVICSTTHHVMLVEKELASLQFEGRKNFKFGFEKNFIIESASCYDFEQIIEDSFVNDVSIGENGRIRVSVVSPSHNHQAIYENVGPISFERMVPVQYNECAVKSTGILLRELVVATGRARCSIVDMIIGLVAINLSAVALSRILRASDNVSKGIARKYVNALAGNRQDLQIRWREFQDSLSGLKVLERDLHEVQELCEQVSQGAALDVFVAAAILKSRVLRGQGIVQ